jgi:hypothetical protein
MEPLSIGTTPLDAVLSFLDAHKDNIEQIFGSQTKGVTNDILQLATLLYAADDSYDSHVRAQDLLYANNWGSSQGGYQWKYDGKATAGQPPAAPNDADLAALKVTNELQAQCDSIAFKLQTKRWALFAEWWKFVSDRSNYNADKLSHYTGVVSGLRAEINGLQSKADALLKQIEAAKTVQESTQSANRTSQPSGSSSQSQPTTRTVPCKKVPLPTYFTKKDPTLCIAGLDSGWPADFLTTTTVELDHQLIEPSKVSGFSQMFGGLSNPVPQAGNLQQTANKLLAECLSRAGLTDATKFTKGYKQWGDANPFAPMFIEWQALYYHVDRTKWDVGVRQSPVGHGTSQVRFSVNKTLYNANDPNMSNQKDYRWASGRVLILPQPGKKRPRPLQRHEAFLVSKLCPFLTLTRFFLTSFFTANNRAASSIKYT